MEVDEEQMEALKNISFPCITGDEDSDMDLREGSGLLKKYITDMSADDLDDLAADYAKVFLAAGDAAGRAAFPYESVYVDRKHQVGGSAAMKMKALFLERGFEPDPGVYRTMDDNIGLILEYMSIICDEITQAADRDDADRVRSLLKEQKVFMKRHILNWIYSFTSDIFKFSERDFYKGIARITNGFIKKETAFLEGGIL